MRSEILAGLLALIGTCSTAQTLVTTDKLASATAANIPLQVHAGGRVLAQAMPGLSPRRIRFVHQWPGVYFEAAFVGTRVALRFDDHLNIYRLLVDDRAPLSIPQPGQSVLRISRLTPGTHRLRLEKVTESASPGGAFLGFFVDDASKPLRVHPRGRQMEFIGDSSVTGYGARSTKLACTSDEVRLTTDTQNAYGALVAKHYDADYQINAVSARGVVRNYSGILPDYTLPRIYPYTFPNKTVPYYSARAGTHKRDSQSWANVIHPPD